MERRPLRVGIVGAGRIVERAHLPLLNGMPGVAVAGLFDVNPERAQDLARRFDVPHVCRSLEDLLRLDLDAAVVACPNYLHAPMSIAALEAGAHVLCEKPMALDSVEAAAMCAAAERAGRELMIGLPNRFRPEVLALRQAIRDGRLGTIKSIRCGWLRRKGIPGVGSWFTSRAQAGGGALNDLGSHVLDLALRLSGARRPLAACCAIDRSIAAQAQSNCYIPASGPEANGCDVEVSASGFAVFVGPLDIFVEVSWACGVPQDRTYLHVAGDRGVARLETVFGFSPAQRPKHPLHLWIDGRTAPPEVTGSTDLLQPYRDQLDFFVESLRSGRSLQPELRDSLATVGLIEALYESAGRLTF
jgi:predicted dehydrogenase